MTAPSNMVEAHAHIAAYGQSLELTDLSGCTDVDECLDLIARERSRLSAHSSHSPAWIRMHGARIEGWKSARWPTLPELDAASGDHPCVVMSFDHHAALANSAAIAAAGLVPGVPIPPSGVVCVDADGHATGLLLEHAAYAAWYAAPEPTPLERACHVRIALQRLAAMGFSEVHDMHSQAWLGPILADLQRTGDLPASVWLYPPVAEIDSAAARRHEWESARIRLAGAKVFADGTLNSRTALMLHPYRDALADLPRGKAMVTPADLAAAVRRTAGLGIGLSVHAIGDAAVRMVLDAFEADTAPRQSERVLRIEHCELIDEADVPRFARLGVVCSVQPCHLLADIEALTRYVPHRLDRVLPLHDLVAAGCRPGDLLWFGSDVPIVRPDPGDSVYAAVRRARPDSPAPAIAPHQHIPEPLAWAAFHRAS
ncbi:MAG: amidohydrolase family protein [Phycisphaeraceae bacterium]|nr:amidohydrolase family protein [Phycisphaeraceae bacterium]